MDDRDGEWICCEHLSCQQEALHSLGKSTDPWREVESTLLLLSKDTNSWEDQTFQSSCKENKVSKFTSSLQKLMQTRTFEDSYTIYPLPSFSILQTMKHNFCKSLLRIILKTAIDKQKAWRHKWHCIILAFSGDTHSMSKQCNLASTAWVRRVAGRLDDS